MYAITEINRQPNASAMRVQCFLSVFLSVFVMVSACQRSVDRMYMDSNDSPATRQVKEESRASLIPSQALISNSLDTDFQNGHGSSLPIASSNDALASTEQSVHVLQPHSTISDKGTIAEAVQGQDEKKEEISQASSNLTDWFQRFVDTVDHAEEWAEVAGLLAEGRRCGYLDKGVVWGDDQYTPLHYAAEVGDLDVTEELVKKYNIPVDIRTDGYQRTPLHLAALRGNLEVVQYLVNKAASDLNAVDSAESNALHYAALGIKGQANTEVIKFRGCPR